MTAVGGNQACLAQQAHGAPYDDRIGTKALRDDFRSHWVLMLRHVEQRVQDGREAAITFHVTYDVT